jgi:hypothetical protein
MDTTTRTFTRILLSLGLPLVLSMAPNERTSHVEFLTQTIVVHDATPADMDLLRWVVGRYEAAGLTLPPLQVYFHASKGGCGGETGLGYYVNGRVDLCTGILINLTVRHTVLHELAHAWTESNLEPDTIARFLDVRGLATWSSWDHPWIERGWEHAAEIIAWGIGERVLMPQVPDTAAEQLPGLYRLLTGMPLPDPA